MNPLFTLIALFACSTHTGSSLGQTLAMQDDAGVVAVTWDGKTARVFRDGREQASKPAATWDAALWGVDLPAYGQVTAPHTYSRALAPYELRALGQCDWAPDRKTATCGLADLCDCSASAPAVAQML